MKIQIINDKGEVSELSESETGKFVQDLKEVYTALFGIQEKTVNSEITPEQVTDINKISLRAKDIMTQKIARAIGVNLE